MGILWIIFHSNCNRYYILIIFDFKCTDSATTCSTKSIFITYKNIFTNSHQLTTHILFVDPLYLIMEDIIITIYNNSEENFVSTENSGFLNKLQFIFYRKINSFWITIYCFVSFFAFEWIKFGLFSKNKMDDIFKKYYFNIT